MRVRTLSADALLPFFTMSSRNGRLRLFCETRERLELLEAAELSRDFDDLVATPLVTKSFIAFIAGSSPSLLR
ncbi:hypothetical protein XH97_01340 [Bradyrhizobium sp. CCBAU 53380]|nr:hypothetical protein [Bradyrhizobium sp. CCBAU 53380]